MGKFKIELKINKPVEIVYSAFMNIGNRIKWFTNFKKTEIVKGKYGEVGAVANLHYNQKLRTVIMKEVMEYIEPGKKIITTVSGEGMIVKIEVLFNSLNGESELVFIWDGKGDVLLLKLFLPFLKGSVRKRIQSELNTFKSLVEEFGENFN